MSRLGEMNFYLLFLFNLIAILAVSWFVSWTYLYSFSGLYVHLSDTDFRNIVLMSMIISTLIVVNGAVILRRFFSRGEENPKRKLRKS